MVPEVGRPILRIRSGGRFRATLQKCNFGPRNHSAENRENREAVALISKTGGVVFAETTVRSNKFRPRAVKSIHNKEHWLTKAEDKYETNDITQNVAGGFRGDADHSNRPAKHDHDDYYKSGDRHNDDGVVHSYHSGDHSRLYPSL